jgi:hypothetical protein
MLTYYSLMLLMLLKISMKTKTVLQRNIVNHEMTFRCLKEYILNMDKSHQLK